MRLQVDSHMRLPFMAMPSGNDPYTISTYLHTYRPINKNTLYIH